MITEQFYKDVICEEIISNFGKERFTKSRMQSLWSGIRHFNEVSAKEGLKEVTKTTLFPGPEKMIELFAKSYGVWREAEVSRIKTLNPCVFCSNGIRQVNGMGFQCSCDLGKIMAPRLPFYTQEATFKDKEYEDTHGNIVLETKTHIYRRLKDSKNIRDCSFTIKESTEAKPVIKNNVVHLSRFQAEAF